MGIRVYASHHSINGGLDSDRGQGLHPHYFFALMRPRSNRGRSHGLSAPSEKGNIESLFEEGTQVSDGDLPLVDISLTLQFTLDRPTLSDVSIMYTRR